MANNCVFCQIVKGEIPSHQVWEDDEHLAFLSIFPNTKGVTVVIPKEHHSSYAFAQSNETLTKLIVATKKVAQKLDQYFQDSQRCGMVFEGFGVNHLHAKLFPMHGTGNLDNWKQIESSSFDNYFENYPGYICSNDSHRANDEELATLAKKIREI